MEIKNTIAVGYKDAKTVRLLPWKNSNGIIVAGMPGSGKTYTASWLLAQYAYNGTSLVICDYGASQTVDQTLLDSIDYLSASFLVEPVSSADTIVEYIENITKLGDMRYNGAIPSDEHYPIVFAIDEFPAFITNYKPPKAKTTKVSGNRKSEEGETIVTQDAPTFLDQLLVSILKLRKVNIHFMLIGQEFAQMGTVGMRAIRSNIRDKVIHKLDKNGATLFGYEDREEKKIVQRLRTGETYFEGEILRTPRMTDTTMNLIQRKVESFKPTKLHPSLWQQRVPTEDTDLLSQLLVRMS